MRKREVLALVWRRKFSFMRSKEWLWRMDQLLRSEQKSIYIKTTPCSKEREGPGAFVEMRWGWRDRRWSGQLNVYHPGPLQWHRVYISIFSFHCRNYFVWMTPTLFVQPSFNVIHSATIFEWLLGKQNVVSKKPEFCGSREAEELH